MFLCVYVSFCGFTLTGSKHIKHAARIACSSFKEVYGLKIKPNKNIVATIETMKSAINSMSPVLNVSFQLKKPFHFNAHNTLLYTHRPTDDGQGLGNFGAKISFKHRFW